MKRSGPIKRRTPLRRTPIRRKPAPRHFAPGEHDRILEWDGMCVLAKVVAGHLCRDQWGNRHDPDRLDLLTVEEFWPDQQAMRKKGPCKVACCAYANAVSLEVSAHRAALRDYVRQRPPAPP